MPSSRPKALALDPSTWDLSPAEVAREMAHCSADASYFINTYYHILERQEDGSKVINQMTMWPYQAQLITAIQSGGHWMVLKARQLGITTVVCGYLTWFALFRPNSYVLLLSKAEGEAEKLLERIKTAYERCPLWMRQIVQPGLDWNKETITFSNGTKVESMAATEKTGRSDTASVIFIDEADYIADLKGTYSGVKPTVDGPGGQLIMASTSQGPMRYWKTLWDGARRKGPDGKPAGKLRGVFFPWPVRPGRTAAWLEHETAEYTEQQRKREYPTRWEDCFSSAEELVYPQFDAAIHMEKLQFDARTRLITTARYGTFKAEFFVGGQDWNTAKPGALLVGGYCRDGTLLIVDGYYEANLAVVSEDTSQFTWSTVAASFQRTYRMNRVWCDHQPNDIAAYRGKGIPAELANKDVASGIGVMIGLLKLRDAVGPQGTVIQRPNLIISDKLTFLVDEFYSYKRRTVNGQITDTVIKENDHGLDAGRYLAVGVTKSAPGITVIGG